MWSKDWLDVVVVVFWVAIWTTLVYLTPMGAI